MKVEQCGGLCGFEVFQIIVDCLFVSAMDFLIARNLFFSMEKLHLLERYFWGHSSQSREIKPLAAIEHMPINRKVMGSNLAGCCAFSLFSIISEVCPSKRCIVTNFAIKICLGVPLKAKQALIEPKGQSPSGFEPLTACSLSVQPTTVQQPLAFCQQYPLFPFS